MRPSRPLPRVGMLVRVRYFGSWEPAEIEAVVGGRRFRLHPRTGKFVAEGEPSYGARVDLSPG